MIYNHVLKNLVNQIVQQPEKLLGSSMIIIRCKCGKEKTISARSLDRKWNNRKEYLCKSCHVKTYINNPISIKRRCVSWKKTLQRNPEVHKKLSDNGKKAWVDPETAIRLKKAISNNNKNNPLKKRAREKASNVFWKKYGPARMKILMGLGHKALKKKLAVDEELRKKYYLNFNQHDPAVKEKHRISAIKASIRRWEDPIYRAKMKEILNSQAYVQRAKENSSNLWKNSDYRNHLLAIYADPEFKKRQSKTSKEIQSRPEVRAAKALALLNMKRRGTSKQEDVFAGILDDMKIQYKRQIIIGYYTFDFLIEPNILIEINGFPHRYFEEIKVRDQAKATYIKEYYSDKYVLKVIWDYEFGSPERLRQIINTWSVPQPLFDFDFKDVEYKVTDDHQIIKEFLGKYHYIGKIGRHSTIVSYSHSGMLIGCIILSYPTRIESVSRLGLKKGELLELTRLCINPQYQKKNFASWMLSKIQQIVKQRYLKAKKVITFADRTFGHKGTIYKAANWVYDGCTEPSYFYRDPDGFVMHKKTLYNVASSNHMTESDFANLYNYEKVPSLPKERYLLVI